MILIEKAMKILDRHLCNHCLGSQFAELLSGFTNEKRGEIVRTVLAMMIDGETIDYSNIEPSNFYGFRFRKNKDFYNKLKEPGKCWLCNDIFDELDKFTEKAEKQLGKIEFNSFLVGCKLPDEILNREEQIWETIGIEWCETLKNTISRIIGKELEKRLKKPIDFRRPDVVVLVDLKNNKVELQVNSLYIFGYYKKFARGIPQCKWGTPGKYKTSVQEIIAKPLMKATKAKWNKFSGSGREDIDARCLDWRAFVIEMLEPKKRTIDLKKIQRMINKNRKVNVTGLKFSDRNTVVRIKTETGEKTYRVLVKLDKPVDKKDLKKLKGLIGVINQRTPERVSARRADLLRRRKVLDIEYRQKDKKTLEMMIKATAGLYVKELINGDNGRTKPSVAEIFGVKAVPMKLDVIKIENKIQGEKF